jgi:ABC-type sugar transport system substrate-binding protein
MLTTLNRSPTTSDAGAARRVALLAANETGTFYMQLKQGAQDAAENLNASLIVEIIDEGGLKNQIAGLEEDGVTAAIIYSEDGRLIDDALSALDAADIASVTLGDDAGDHAILDDMEADASALADAAKTAGCRRALVIGENAALAEAFESAWNGEVVEVDDISTADVRPGDCAVTLTAEATMTAMARDMDIPLFGVDTGETRAEDLETGKVDAMLLSRPYAIGYRAMEAALTGGKGVTYVSAKLVTPETMYLPENVDIVYPLIQ